MPNEIEFIQTIKENEGIIFKITSVYASDPDDRKDLYQEIVFQLWKSFDSFQQQAKRSTWLYRVALNTSITYLNRAKKTGNKVPIDDNIINLSESQDPSIEEKINLLYRQIKNLDNTEKGIVVMYLEGNSYAEIASITGFTPTNIGTRLSRIKQKLKAQVKIDQSWN